MGLKGHGKHYQKKRPLFDSSLSFWWQTYMHRNGEKERFYLNHKFHDSRGTRSLHRWGQTWCIVLICKVKKMKNIFNAIVLYVK
jgi:hypothetical protein